MKEKIIVVGETMLDIHVFGKIERINPEAPVPVLHVIKGERHGLGGAANVANNLANLNANVIFLSLVNGDSFGNKIKEMCDENKLPFHFISDGRPTIVKQRFVAAEYNQQVLRVDYEDITPISEENSDKMINFITKESPSFVLISDYGKGLVTDYFMQQLKENYKGKIIVDPKPKNIHNYKDIYLLKPNIIEAENILGRKLKETELELAVKELSEKFNCNTVMTLGKQGVIYYNKETSETKRVPSYAKEVFDVSGCGDTFIATLTYSLANEDEFDFAIDLANKAASIVISKFGAVPIIYNELFEK